MWEMKLYWTKDNTHNEKKKKKSNKENTIVTD